MAKFKQKFKYYAGYVWQMIKSSLPSMFMYLCAGTILMLIFFSGVEEDQPLEWKNKHLIWAIVCIVVAAAYDGLIAWANGGSHYEMLVSGNIKRSTADMYGTAYKMSSHKEAKEYRIWKGFVVGAIIGLFPLVMGIIFGCNQTTIDTSLTKAPWALVGFILSGWSIIPFYGINLTGAGVSYFLTCLFALLPICVHGGFYIAGAYAKRNKTIRQQILADKAAEAEANKPKKINYGGLPGTKPKKRK